MGDTGTPEPSRIWARCTSRSEAVREAARGLQLLLLSEQEDQRCAGR